MEGITMRRSKFRKLCFIFFFSLAVAAAYYLYETKLKIIYDKYSRLLAEQDEYERLHRIHGVLGKHGRSRGRGYGRVHPVVKGKHEVVNGVDFFIDEQHVNNDKDKMIEHEVNKEVQQIEKDSQNEVDDDSQKDERQVDPPFINEGDKDGGGANLDDSVDPFRKDHHHEHKEDHQRIYNDVEEVNVDGEKKMEKENVGGFEVLVEHNGEDTGKKKPGVELNEANRASDTVISKNTLEASGVPTDGPEVGNLKGSEVSGVHRIHQLMESYRNKLQNVAKDNGEGKQMIGGGDQGLHVKLQENPEVPGQGAGNLPEGIQLNEEMLKNLDDTKIMNLVLSGKLTREEALELLKHHSRNKPNPPAILPPHITQQPVVQPAGLANNGLGGNNMDGNVMAGNVMAGNVARGNVIGAQGGNAMGALGGNAMGAQGGTAMGAQGGNVIGAQGGNVMGALGGNVIGAPGGNAMGALGGNAIGAQGGNALGALGGNAMGAIGGNAMGANIGGNFQGGNGLAANVPGDNVAGDNSINRNEVGGNVPVNNANAIGAGSIGGKALGVNDYGGIPFDVFNVHDVSDESIACVQLNLNTNTTTVCVNNPLLDKPISASLAKNGIWEAQNLKEFQKAMEACPKCGVIDLGANLGVYSLTAAAYHRPVLAVEPLLENIGPFHRAIQVNKLMDNITVLRNAISHEHGYVEMKYPKPMGNLGAAYAVPIDYNQALRRKTNINVQIVQTITLNDLVKILKFKSAILKVDIQGSEHQMFRAAGQFLDEIDVPFIFMHWAHEENKKESLETADFLVREGYKPKITIQGTLIELEALKRDQALIIWTKQYT